jgi:hypothetical protein
VFQTAFSDIKHFIQKRAALHRARREHAEAHHTVCAGRQKHLLRRLPRITRRQHIIQSRRATCHHGKIGR